MKKVLFVTTISGFLPQFEKNDVKILQKMGCEIHYASNFKNPIYAFNEQELIKQGIRLHQIDIAKSPSKIGTNIKATCQLRKIIDENGIDVMHCHNPMGGVAGRIAASISKRKPYIIYTAHGFHFYKGASAINWSLFYTTERFLAHFTNALITINQEDFQRASKFHLKKDGKVYQIHGVGVDQKQYIADQSIREEKRTALGIPRDAFHIVTAAEINDNKNQKVIVEAIRKLNKTNIYYSICGKGPGEEKLQRLIQENGLSNQVHMLGFRTDMQEILQTADVFAFPSIREGLGVAALEALLCGVPLIAADNRGTREYAANWKNSLVCKADDVPAFTEAIRRMQEDKELRKQMCSKCRSSALKFTIEEVEKTMKNVYERALM